MSEKSDAIILGLLLGGLGGFRAAGIYEELTNLYMPSQAGVCIYGVMFLGGGALIGALLGGFIFDKFDDRS